MKDFTIFYKDRLSIDDISSLDNWDLMLSAYRTSERVKRVFGETPANKKIWISLPEYALGEEVMPQENIFRATQDSEATLFHDLREFLGDDLSTDTRLCVDITGFVGHYVVYLLKWLQHLGVRKFDALYAEPATYNARADTRFSDEVVVDVRQIDGFEGVHTTSTESDLLVVGAGYDNQLIDEVASKKDCARKRQIFGLPSVHPDMFQDNVLRSRQAGTSLGSANDPNNYHYAPASDPFVTAQVLKEIVANHRQQYKGGNVYLSPLSTKPQALGFALYYLFEEDGGPTSIIYPICQRYEQATAKGLSSVWKFQVELPKKRERT